MTPSAATQAPRRVAGTVRVLAGIPIPRGPGPAAGVLYRVDCGEFHPFGICPRCGRGHGIVVFRRNATTALMAGAAVPSNGVVGRRS
jgi:hypothetical protein